MAYLYPAARDHKRITQLKHVSIHSKVYNLEQFAPKDEFQCYDVTIQINLQDEFHDDKKY